MTTNNDAVQARRNEILAVVKQKYGFVPNVLVELAESPAAAEAYINATGALVRGLLSPKEQQLVQLSVASYNSCHYCTAIHGTAGLKSGLSEEDVEAVLSGDFPGDDRARSLVEATWLVLDRRGWLDASDLQRLEDRGVRLGRQCTRSLSASIRRHAYITGRSAPAIDRASSGIHDGRTRNDAAAGVCNAQSRSRN